MKYAAIFIAIVLHGLNCVVYAGNNSDALSYIHIHIGQDTNHIVNFTLNNQSHSRESLDNVMLRVASLDTKQFIDVTVDTNAPISYFFSLMSSLTSKGFSSIRVWSDIGDTVQPVPQGIQYIFNPITTRGFYGAHNEAPKDDIEISIIHDEPREIRSEQSGPAYPPQGVGSADP